MLPHRSPLAVVKISANMAVPPPIPSSLPVTFTSVKMDLEKHVASVPTMEHVQLDNSYMDHRYMTPKLEPVFPPPVPEHGRQDIAELATTEPLASPGVRYQQVEGELKLKPGIAKRKPPRRAHHCEGEYNGFDSVPATATPQDTVLNIHSYNPERNRHHAAPSRHLVGPVVGPAPPVRSSTRPTRASRTRRGSN
jgi:hypothetical protein